MDLHTHRSLYVLLEQSEMGRPPGRPPDQFFWDRVDIIPGWKCKLCKQVISYDAYTINVHLAKVEDEGIKICKGEVDRETLHAAKEAVRDLKGKGAKRGRSMETGTTSARPHPLVADSRNTLRSLDQSNPISVSPQGAKHSIRSLEANSLHSEGCVPDADQLFWDRGDIIEQWKWECKFCKKDFSGGVSRIKAHLAKVKSLGIQICEGEVDIETLDAAKEAVRDLKRGVKRKWSKETGTTSADPSADEAPQQGNTSGRSHPLVADSGNTLRSLDQSNPISVSPQGALDTIPPRHPELRDQDSISNQHINSAPTIHQVATDLQTLNLANHHTRLQGDNDTNQTSFPVDMTQAYIVTGLTAGTSNLQGFTRIDTNISDGRVNAKTRELHEALLDVPVIRSSEPDGLLERTQMGRSANCRPNAGAVPVGAVTLQNTQHSTDPQAPIQLGRPTFSETQTSATSHDSSYKKYITFEAYSLHSEGCVPDAAATAPEIQSAHSCGTQIVRSTDFLRDADLAPVNQQDIQHSTAGIDPSVETSGYGHAGNARAGDIPRNNIVPEQPNHLEPMHIDTEAINPSTRAIPSLQLNVRDDVHGASNSINVSPVEAADTIHLTNPPRHPESRVPDRISNQPISSGFQPPSIQPCAKTGLAAGFEQMDIEDIGAAVGTSNAGGITNADWRNTACSNHNPQDPSSISQNSCSSMIQELQNNDENSMLPEIQSSEPGRILLSPNSGGGPAISIVNGIAGGLSIVFQPDACSPPVLPQQNNQPSTAEHCNLLQAVENRKRSSTGDIHENRQSEIIELEPQPVGRDSIMNKIQGYFKTDQNLCIGVHGMGGVGKTTIMQHLYKEACRKGIFDEVFWITVPRDCSLHELQNKLAIALKGHEDFRNTDEMMRPSFLHKRLRTWKKCLIILDDVWQYFDLNKLGITLKEDGIIQLVLTTRDGGVCRSMMCQKVFEVGLLPYNEAWNLFERTLEYEISPSRKLIAEGIVRKCRGLPLAIVIMAKGMREVDSDHGWNCTLEKLGHPEAQVEPNMQTGVFPVLYHSYSRLDEKKKECFRLCALSRGILRGELIELFIDEGVICNDSRRKMYDEGHHILDELEKKSLLEKVVLEDENQRTDEEKEVRMHDVIHDLALHVMNSEQRPCMVKCSSGSNEIPCEDGWSRDLQKVSLVDNSFMKELPSLQSNCPKLSTLLVSGCYNLSEIPKCFFERAKGLKVIDISSTAIATVPGSIIKLKILNALILRGCRKLLSIPSLATLTSLRKLDLGDCELIDAVPDGVEMLVNLTYLDLSWTSIEEIKAGVVGKLQKLQYLGLGCAAVQGKEVATLKKLEIMSCRFKEMNELSDYMQHRQHESTLKAYTLLIGDDNNDWKNWNYCILSANGVEIWEDENFLLRWDMKAVILERVINFAGETLHIPSDVTALRINCDGEISYNFNQQDCRELLQRLTKLKRLEIDTCKELKSITEEGQVEEGKFTQLQSISISMCPKMRHVVGPELLPRLHNLRSIEIFYCENMEEVIGMPYGPPPLANTPILTLLTTITIGECPKLRHVVGSELLPHLHNLRNIEIFCCENMEEVIGMPSESPPLANTPFLPLLREITIFGCPKMRRLLTLELFTHLPNLESINVSQCDGMKEVIGTKSDHGIGTISNRDACMLPPPSLSSRKPLSIHLDTLPELESISNWPHIRSFIRRIHIKECPKLKSIPFLDGFPSAPPFLQKFVIHSYQQWESMEWEHPQAKDSLEPYVFIISEYYDELPIEEWRLEHLHPPVIEEEPTAVNHFPTSS